MPCFSAHAKSDGVRREPRISLGILFSDLYVCCAIAQEILNSHFSIKYVYFAQLLPQPIIMASGRSFIAIRGIRQGKGSIMPSWTGRFSFSQLNLRPTFGKANKVVRDSR